MSREISFENIKKSLGIDHFHELIDTHMHLDYLKFKTQEEIVELSSSLGVTKMITIAVSEKHQDEIIELSSNFIGVYATQGIHPHHASELTPALFEKITKNCENKKVVSIGEVGLDYHYDYSPRDVQRRVFEEMIDLSIKKSLPLIIHTREAEEDTMSILKNFNLTNGVLFHSYSSNLKLAEFGVREGYYFGFNGMVTFKKAENVREALTLAPLNRLLLETDAPFLAPNPFRGVENGPYLLPFVAKEMAALKGTSYKEIALKTTENSHRLFKLS